MPHAPAPPLMVCGARGMVCRDCPLPNPRHGSDLRLGDAHHPQGRDPTGWRCANFSSAVASCDAGTRHDHYRLVHHPGCRLVPAGCHHSLFGKAFLAFAALVLRASRSWGGVLAHPPVSALLLVARVVVEATSCVNLAAANVMCDPGSQLACFGGKPLMDHPLQVLQPWGHLSRLQRLEQSPQVPQPPNYFHQLELP